MASRLGLRSAPVGLGDPRPLAAAYWLELDNAFWAGTSAGIVCQPSLGASLRKGWFRAIGTAVGAIFIVALTALFPQSRAGMLIGLDLWCGLCGLMATVLRNFAGYAAALAGVTAAIVFADALTAPERTFVLAVSRATEICIGILSAGLVLMLTDAGSARRKLALAFADAIDYRPTGTFGATLTAGRDFAAIRTERRSLTARVAILHVAIDEAIGEFLGAAPPPAQPAGGRGVVVPGDFVLARRCQPSRGDRQTPSSSERQKHCCLRCRPKTSPPHHAVRRLLRWAVADIGSRFLVDDLCARPAGAAARRRRTAPDPGSPI